LTGAGLLNVGFAGALELKKLRDQVLVPGFFGATD